MFKKIIISATVLLGLVTGAKSQEFDYFYHRMIADSLAYLSLGNTPVIQQQDYELAIREEKIVREKLGWLSSFKMGVQFLQVSNDYDANVTKVGVLPTLGVSLQVDFERFFTTPSRIRSARHESQIIKLEKQRLIQVRENQITGMYFDYVMQIEKTQARYNTLQTVKDQAKLVEEQFRAGETDLDTYLNAVNAIDNATEAFYETKITAEKLLAALEIEIGLQIGEIK
ncbi:MAG: TolC family protein [Balneolales bacterium]|nr:TolC family protein [Balneolales bacterium]